MIPEPSSPMDYGPTSNGISFASLRMCQGHKLRFKNTNHPENRRESSWRRRRRRKSKRGQEKGRVIKSRNTMKICYMYYENLTLKPIVYCTVNILRKRGENELNQAMFAWRLILA